MILVSNINIKLIIIIFIASIIVIFGGNYLVANYRLNHSLHNDLLALDAVEELEISEMSDDSYELAISLSGGRDLQPLVTKIDQLVINKTGESQQINFNLTTKSKFENEYRQLSFLIYEVIETGEFTKLLESRKDYKTRLSLDALKFDIDKDYIYLSFARDGEYFYKIIERREEEQING